MNEKIDGLVTALVILQIPQMIAVCTALWLISKVMEVFG